MWRSKFKTRKVSPPINKDSSSLESNWRTEELCLTITYRKNQPFTWCWDSEVVAEVPLPSNPPSLLLPESTSAKRWFAESATLPSPLRLPTAERESAVTTPTSDPRRSSELLDRSRSHPWAKSLDNSSNLLTFTYTFFYRPLYKCRVSLSSSIFFSSLQILISNYLLRPILFRFSIMWLWHPLK